MWALHPPMSGGLMPHTEAGPSKLHTRNASSCRVVGWELRLLRPHELLPLIGAAGSSLTAYSRVTESAVAPPTVTADLLMSLHGAAASACPTELNL